MFQLNEMEHEKILRCKNCTSSYGGRRYLPYAFTEQGVNQLSSVLKGPIAVKQSVNIIRVFVKMRHYLLENRQLFGNAEILKITHSLIEEEISNNYKETKREIKSIKENLKEFVFKNVYLNL